MAVVRSYLMTETLPKILIAWVGCTNVTDRQTDGRMMTYSEREHEFTFANKFNIANICTRGPQSLEPQGPEGPWSGPGPQDFPADNFPLPTFPGRSPKNLLDSKIGNMWRHCHYEITWQNIPREQYSNVKLSFYLTPFFWASCWWMLTVCDVIADKPIVYRSCSEKKHRSACRVTHNWKTCFCNEDHCNGQCDCSNVRLQLWGLEFQNL